MAYPKPKLQVPFHEESGELLPCVEEPGAILKANGCFYDELKFEGFARFYERNFGLFRSLKTGHRLPMHTVDLDVLLRLNGVAPDKGDSPQVAAWFTFVERHHLFGIRLIRDADERHRSGIIVLPETRR